VFSYAIINLRHPEEARSAISKDAETPCSTRIPRAIWVHKRRAVRERG
jgi:hypothetical protein